MTDLRYHPRGWLRERSVRARADGTPDAGDATTTMDHDAAGNLQRLTQPDGSFLEYTWDNANRLVGIRDNLGNAIHYTLDALGHRIAEETFAAEDPVTPRRLLTRSYDTLARLAEQHDAQGRATHFAHDVDGNRTEVTDARGIRSRFEYDPLSRLRRELRDWQGSDPATADTTTGYAYDARDNLREVTDPDGLITSYDQDGLDNLAALHSPDTGDQSYTHDAAGNRRTHTDARGVTATYSHDALNRLTAIAWPDPALDVHYAWDEPDALTGCSGSFPLGRLTRMQDAAGSTTWCHDRRGNVTRKVEHTRGLRLETRYRHDLADRLTGVTYPSGAQLDYTRDAAGRITGATLTPPGGSPVAILTEVAWEPFGPVRRYGFAGGQVQERAHDGNYWLTDIAGSGLALHFCHDATGNITKLRPSAGADCAALPQEAYGYDALERLREVETGTGASVERYSYNATGDRLTKETGNQMPEPYDYAPGTHRLVGVAGVPRSVDPAGNTTVIGSRQFEFDATNRLAKVTETGTTLAEYAYSGKGERRWKAAGGESRWFTYSETGALLGEYAGTTGREYIWVEDTPVALIDLEGLEPADPDRIFTDGFEQVTTPVPTASLYYLHPDQLGSPRAATTPGGATVWSWPWAGNPFGEAQPTGSLTLNLRFPGQYHDAETGLHYNYFRDYEPGTGRYIESDPIGLLGGVATYGYVKGMPFRLTDPTGLATAGTIPWTEAPPSVWPEVWKTCRAVATSTFAIAVILATYSPSTSACDQPYPPPQNHCDDGDNHCEEEISDCRKLCRKARNDADMKNIWGGSWARCMAGCVSFACQDYLDPSEYEDPGQ